MNTIRQLCDRCIVLNKGKIVYDGEVEGGIDLYLQNVDNYLDFLPKLYNLNAVEREWEKFGQNVFINEVEFLDCDQPCYKEGDKIRFRMSWKSFFDIGNLRIRIALKKMDGTNVGMAELKNPINAKKDCSYDQIFEFDVSNICDGLYFFKLYICQKNDSNVLLDLDAATVKIFFRILPNTIDRTVWIGNYWGSVRLNDIVLIEENING